MDAIHSFVSSDWFEITKLLFSALTFFSIFIAYQSYKTNLRKLHDDRVREKDKELLVQVEKSIKWAHDVLTNEGKEVPPKPDRLNWLTSARHLLRAKKLANLIENQTYRTVYEEIEEYWRHRFYVTLSHKDLRNWTYYGDQSRPEWPENIEITSALVLVNFSNWKKGVSDPTENVDRKILIDEEGTLKSSVGRGLEAYMVRFEEIKAQRHTED